MQIMNTTLTKTNEEYKLKMEHLEKENHKKSEDANNLQQLVNKYKKQMENIRKT